MEENRGFAIDAGIGSLRAVFGLILAFVHGWQKLGGAAGFLFAGHAWAFVGLVRSLGFPLPAFFAVCAALSESAGALCVACGLLTRISAALVTITMTVAAYTSLRTGAPIELSVLYGISFLAITITGPGRFSLDSLLWRAHPVSRSAK
ncbi:MAG TPA: DoxX family protein [Silvibacterium sp.]|nr:DoxX family protein [Silvibacterium sp.]